MAALHVHARLPFLSRGSTCGQLIFGQHAMSFHPSRILADTVPLGFCCGGFSSTAGYDPATKLNFRRAARPLWRVLYQRVPLVFIQVVRESLATFSSKAFRLRLKASLGLAAACLSSQPVRHRIGHRLFVGLEGRNPRDRCFIP